MTADPRPALQAITTRIMEWSDAAGHTRNIYPVALKMHEEAGEVAGAIVKRDEHRPDGIDRTSQLYDELGDLFITVFKICAVEGFDPTDVILDRLVHNEQREHIEYPCPGCRGVSHDHTCGG